MRPAVLDNVHVAQSNSAATACCGWRTTGNANRPLKMAAKALGSPPRARRHRLAKGVGQTVAEALSAQGEEAVEDAEAPWLADLRGIIDISAFRCWGLSNILDISTWSELQHRFFPHMVALLLLGLAALAAL